MTQYSAASIRQLFLDFFKARGHAVVKSSPLVPADDPTLMFVNSGMVQFKHVFVGAESRPYKRATTVQKCMRVSGKHNDLEEVGRTARHHTFFEMLGNFSFGDYFKEEAITLAWDLITRELGLDKGKLWITVFGGAEGVPADAEARALWRKVTGLPDSRILDKGMKDNFWAMGDTGPCGPCTEIHVDQGVGEVRPEDFDNGRVMEIWNLVFMQFDRQAGGQLLALPAPSVDTGLGLERLVALVQGADSNYHSDMFAPLLEGIAAAAKKPYTRSASEDDVSMRVIADHARAASFLVADGMQPSNEGRGYVMRRIMRRAIRHGKRLGFDDLFLHDICDIVVGHMGDAYPELREARSLIEKVAQLEEEGFRRTLDTGLRILGDAIGEVKQGRATELPGEIVFKLYDTYGFPKDLTEVIATENGLRLDEAGFDRHMEAQKERSRGSEVGSAAVAGIYKQVAQELGPVHFVGYPHEDEPLGARRGTWRRGDDGAFLELETTVKALIQNGARVFEAGPGEVEVVLEPTPFYGESGGQVGDRGRLTDDGTVQAEVRDTLKPVEDLTVARVHLAAGRLKVGQTLWAGYDATRRRQTRAHHSATHLLHGALRKVLGQHVKQAGSLVDAEHLRFDFAHFSSLTHDELRAIEEDANARIAANHGAVIEELAFDQAKEKGAIALFGEKYGDRVRVITMGDSVEFCGGTHVHHTGELGMLLVTREEAVQSGVRRIEAEVGLAAQRTTQRMARRLSAAGRLLQGESPAADADDTEAQPVLQAIQKLVDSHRRSVQALEAAGVTPAPVDVGRVRPARLEGPPTLAQARGLRDAWQGLVQLVNARAADAPAIVARYGVEDPTGALAALGQLVAASRDNEKAQGKLASQNASSLARELTDRAETVAGVRLVAASVAEEAGALRDLADAVRSQLGSGVVCLSAVSGGKVTLLVAVTKDLTGRFAAGKLIGQLAPLVGGRGGGKPDLAQAGGSQAEGVPAAFAKLRELVGTG
jgi:alanyl-tRNA synthetase